MAEPSPAERALLGVYQAAERALLVEVKDTVVTLVDGSPASEAERRADGLHTVRRAARGVAGQLDVVTPGLFTDALAEAAAAGDRDAVAQLRAATPGPRKDAYAEQAVNRGALDRLAVALIDRAAEAHRAILRTVPDRYRDIVGSLLPANLVGVETRRALTQRAMWEASRRGIAGFTDARGRNWQLSSYMEMATRTATARAKLDATHDRLAADGRDLVIVNGSGDRCERCRPWHGKVLTISGRGRGTIRVEHGIRDGEYVTVEVAGSVADARSAGWGHPQCRCSTAAYLPGVTRVPPPPPKDGDGQYEARQRQRAIERQIRAAKGDVDAALDKAGRARAKARLDRANARMREHLDANPDLLRRRYREQTGAGNLPSAAQKARFDADARTKGPAAPKATTVTRLRDDVVQGRMNSALDREDFDAFDVYAAESDRRDARRVTRADRDRARRDAAEEAKAADMERRLSAGQDEESAVEDVYGVSIDRQRRQAANARLDADGYRGTFDQKVRAAHADDVARRYVDAEDATNGYMLTREGTAAGIDPLSLFKGPASRVRKYASPELKEWFDQHGRPTVDEYKADLLGDGGAAGRMRAERGDFYT